MMGMILHICVLLFWVGLGLSTTHPGTGGDDCGFLITSQWLDSVKVVLNLTKSGFHRDLIYTVKFGAPFLKDVQALLIQNIGGGVYMDVYQLQSLREDTGLHVLLDSEVDLEAPAYESSGFTALVYPGPDPAIPGLLTATVPIHGRYHRPADPGVWEKVKIKHPKLLLKSDTCEHGKSHLSSLSHKIVYAPCSVHNISICSWIEIEDLQVPQSVVLDLPVGDKTLIFIVCAGTLLITILCNLILMATIWKYAIF